MKKILQRFFLIILLLSTHYGFGYFYYLSIVKVDRANGPQYIVLLADYHDKDHYANYEQRTYFESLLVKCCNKKVKLIIEDLSSVNNEGRMMCGTYGINCRQSVLGHLAHTARLLGIEVDNIEYRYCRVVSIGPLIANITSDPYSFQSSRIPIASLYKEIIHEIEKIKTYDDGKILNDFYKNTVTAIMNKLARMHLGDKSKKRTVADHCAQLKRKKYRQKLEELCTFDSGLIDSNIIHSIVSCDVSIVFVLAGGSHIEQVKSVLLKNRYQSVFSTPLNETFQPTDLSILSTMLD